VLIVDPSVIREIPATSKHNIIAPEFALKDPGFAKLTGYKILAGGRQLGFTTTFFDVFKNGVSYAGIYPQKIGFKDFLSGWKISVKEDQK
jgi:hypothetical protein